MDSNGKGREAEVNVKKKWHEWRGRSKNGVEG